MLIFGFDPGKSTGYCQVKIEGKKFIPIDVRVLQPDGVLNWCYEELLNEDPYDCDVVIVCEDYIINPKVYHYSHQGDSGLALRLIGMLQLTAHTLGWQFRLQMPTCKPAGYGFLGSRYERDKKGRHIQDATAHAMYYCMMERIVDIEVSQMVQSKDVPKPSGPRKFRKESVAVWHKPGKES